MGGNIWKDQSVRLSLENYLQIEKEVIELLGEVQLKQISFMKGKETFGDLDLIVGTKYRHSITEQLKKENYLLSSNGEVLSFLYKSFQVDLIFVDESRLDFAAAYFSNNDVGNILGRMAKQLGLKYGHKGLYYVNRTSNNDRILSETLLSLNVFDIYNILKVPTTLLTDSLTKLEAFQLISQSPYFNKEIYSFENLNHQNKVRDRKRKTYNDFLEFCKDLPVKPIYKFDKESVVCYLYPHLIPVIQADALREQQNSLLQMFFGGERIKNITGYENIELGLFIKNFKKTYSREFLLSVINKTKDHSLNNGDQTVQLIKDFHEQYIAAIMSTP